MSKVLTVCPFCGSGCGVFLEVDGNQIIGVAPSKSHPVSKGSLYIKGWNCNQFVHHPERLRTPLIRDGDSFKEVSWKQALSTVARKFNEIKDTQGADAIGVVGSIKTTNEEHFLLMKLARAALGTNNIDTSARFYHGPTVAGLVPTLGYGAMTNSVTEINQARVILLVGANPKSQIPRIGALMIRAIKEGTQLIVADPRSSQMAHFATLHLRPKPGTDLVWINALMRIIIDKGWHKETGKDFDTFKNSLQKYADSYYVAEATGISIGDLTRAAELFAKAERAMIFYGTGLTQQASGTQAVMALVNLALLTGNLGKEGTGVNPLMVSNNLQGAMDMGLLPDYLSGFQSIGDKTVRSEFEKAWKTNLPENPGLTLGEMVSSAQTGKLKAMYVVGENLVQSAPDQQNTIQALKKLDFLVVQELFMTETAQLAQVVLPACSFAEKDGTFTNTDRRVQRVRKAINPIADSKPDWEIISLLSTELGYAMKYKSPEAIMEEIASLTPIYNGIRYEKLNGNGGLQWPVRGNGGTPFLAKQDWGKGFGKFTITDFKFPSEPPDGEYPLTLITGRADFHWLTGTLIEKSNTLRKEVPVGYIEINPEEARALKLKTGAQVKVVTRRGSIVRGVVVTDRVPPRMVFVPFHYKDGATNILTNPILEKDSRIPEFKVCAVKLETK